MKRFNWFAAVGLLASACGGCGLFGESGWDLDGTATVPVEQQQPYSAAHPGRLLMGNSTSSGNPPYAIFLLAVLCDSSAVAITVPATERGLGCAEQHEVAVWVEPFAASGLAATPCAARPADWPSLGLKAQPETATASARQVVFQGQPSCESKDTLHLTLTTGRPF